MTAIASPGLRRSGALPCRSRWANPWGSARQRSPPRAATLGLDEPVITWHTNRVASARLVCALGVLAGALAKIARDVTLSEHLRGASPAGAGILGDAHKRNPVAACVRARMRQAHARLGRDGPRLMEQEHERAARAWQAEWTSPTC